MDLTFWCPECESHHFGSSGNKGRCHGCGHEWDRSQDYVYFVLVRRFTSPKEYVRQQRGFQALQITVAVSVVTVALMVAWFMTRVP